jgi:hypothetical protein
MCIIYHCQLCEEVTDRELCLKQTENTFCTDTIEQVGFPCSEDCKNLIELSIDENKS